MGHVDVGKWRVTRSKENKVRFSLHRPHRFFFSDDGWIGRLFKTLLVPCSSTRRQRGLRPPG